MKMSAAHNVSSRGLLVHPDPLGAENFARWFGSSAVVDASGSPIVMYHGTTQSFESFDPKKIGANFASDEKGFFAISCPKLASEYADGDGGNVMPLFVSLQKPLVINAEFLASEGMAPLGETECVITFWDNYQGLIFEWIDARKSDGVILFDSLENPENPTIMTVAMRPGQMKSAIGNSGLFLKSSASMTDSENPKSKATMARALSARLAISTSESAEVMNSAKKRLS